MMIGGHEFARRSGIPYRKIDYWARTGLLLPAQGSATPGMGAQRRYSVEQIPAAQILERLMSIRDTHSKGASAAVHDATRRIIEHVAAHGPRGVFELIPGVTVDVAKVLRSVRDEAAA